MKRATTAAAKLQTFRKEPAGARHTSDVSTLRVPDRTSLTPIRKTSRQGDDSASTDPLPAPEMRLNGPCFDGFSVRSGGNGVVVAQGFELGIEFERSVPPLVEKNLSTTNGQEPFRRLALYREVQVSGPEQLQTLKSKSRTVHGVLGVVAIFANELVSLTTPSSTMAASADAQKSGRL